ncbi:putative transporter, partial [Lachnellula cervina]
MGEGNISTELNAASAPGLKIAVKEGQGDAALAFLETSEVVTYTRKEEKAIVRKIDWVLMPLMTISYTIQYMDKSVMAQAAVYDLIKNLGLKGQEYSWCSSIFYFGYLAFQPFAARLLNYFPLGRFVGATSIVWGVILFCTAGAMDFKGMMAVRFFLGLAEAGVSPAYVLITGTWYKKDEIPLRITTWYCGNGFAIILQSLIAYGIGHIHTGIAVWRWFFIIFGILGLVWGFVLWFFMPDSPLTARFLNDRERAVAIERLRDNRTGIENTTFKRDQLVEALTDVKVWYGFFYSIACVVPATAVANFGGLIIKGFGFNSFETSLLNTPLGLTQCMGLVTAGFVTLYFPNTRCLMQFLCNVPAVIGSVLVYTLPYHNRTGRLIAFYCTNFTNASLPMMFALTTTNIAGQTKRSVSTALLFIGYSTAFIIGPQFFRASEAPKYGTGFKTMIIMFSIAALAPGLYFLYATWLNRRKQKNLEENGDDNGPMVNEEFFDLTDKQQPRFVYV